MPRRARHLTPTVCTPYRLTPLDLHLQVGKDLPGGSLARDWLPRRALPPRLGVSPGEAKVRDRFLLFENTAESTAEKIVAQEIPLAALAKVVHDHRTVLDHLLAEQGLCCGHTCCCLCSDTSGEAGSVT